MGVKERTEGIISTGPPLLVMVLAQTAHVKGINRQFSYYFTEDVTPPVLSFVNAPLRSGGEVEITWTANENVTSQCTLQTPSQITAQPCNMSWTGTNLTEGYHSIYVQITDLAGNTAPPVRHSWFVGTSL